MQLSICSFSFHRLLAAGKQDIFRYITDCKELGCTQLDPWNAHLSDIRSGDEVMHAGHNPNASQHLSAGDEDYIDRVKAAAEAAELPFGCIAVDGAHIYEENEEARHANRARAYRWLDVASKLAAKQVRIDAGGPEDMPEPIFDIIVEGYKDVIEKAGERGIQVLVENHWGPTNTPDNVLRLLEAIPGLGLLFDSHNWKDEVRAEARVKCAKFASATHIKTLDWDDLGNEIKDDPETAIRLLLKTGYKGTWGIESCPADGDEYGGVKKTIALIKKYVEA